MSDVPVALFVYNRPHLLQRTLGCLREAGFRRLLVFSEGPESPADEALVQAVRSEIGRVDWAEVELTARDQNLGWTASLRQGLEAVFAREERAVVIEDDVAVAPEFRVFVESALEAYAEDDRVAGVTGLRLPFGGRRLRSYPYDAYCLPRFFSWSWATWRRAWTSFEFEGDVLLARLKDDDSIRPEQGGADLPWMIRRGLVERTLADPWDVALSLSMLLDGRQFVVPTWNMVEHTGGGTGLHGPRPGYRLRWERERRPADVGVLRFPPPEVDPGLLKAFHVFKENPRGWTPRRLVPRPLRQAVRRVRGTYDVFGGPTPANAERR